MVKKKHKCPEGAPEWMVTYGDMVTLLLCFFVLIVSFSEIKKEDQFQAVVEEIQKAFGMKGGGGKLPTDDDPALSLIELLESTRMRQEAIPNRSNVKDPGMRGREPQVTSIREGKRYEIGGSVLFEPDMAELTEEGKAQLIDLVSSLKLVDSRNKIELTGHAAVRELPGPNGEQGNLDRLGMDRAFAVKSFLTGEEIAEDLRLEPNRFKVASSGASEPIDSRAYSTAQEQVNRRVAIVVTENVVEDYQQ